MDGKPKREHGEVRRSSPTDPAIIETPQGPILVYRLARGRVSFVYPKGVKVRKRVSRAIMRKAER
jgi:hypothetical protein